ncbi:MAG TPA: hypothetical protein VIM16_03100 [Mucilaginibacter sp.]|jgi:hypothetical protein
MKQLLLNSLLVVGSAFIYVQCVKLLTTTNKLSKHELQNQAKIDIATDEKQNKAGSSSTNISTARFNFKNKAITPFFDNPAFPYDMMQYMNYSSLFYDSYISLNHYDLVRKYKSEPQPNK